LQDFIYTAIFNLNVFVGGCPIPIENAQYFVVNLYLHLSGEVVAHIKCKNSKVPKTYMLSCRINGEWNNSVYNICNDDSSIRNNTGKVSVQR